MLIDREKLPGKPLKSTFAGASVQGRLDELLHLIRALGPLTREALERQEAVQRFTLSGEAAPPLSSRQVAYVLNTTVSAVNQLTHRGELPRRFGCRGFHADDVRGYLKACAHGMPESEPCAGEESAPLPTRESPPRRASAPIAAAASPAAQESRPRDAWDEIGDALHRTELSGRDIARVLSAGRQMAAVPSTFTREQVVAVALQLQKRTDVTDEGAYLIGAIAQSCRGMEQAPAGVVVVARELLEEV